jgi:serralysin
MCILCSAQSSLGNFLAASANSAGHVQAGSGAVSTASGNGMQNVDALISGFKWSGTALTFVLPTQAAQYASYDPLNDETGSFAGVQGSLATAVRAAMAQFSAVSALSITEVSNTPLAPVANIFVGRTGQTQTAHAYLPDGYYKEGDVWFGTSSDYDIAVKGDYAWSTTLHEIGHALGLKHSHTYLGGVGVYEDDVGVISLPLTADRDSLEFSIMSYRSYIGQDLTIFDYYTNEDFGFSQSLMMYDIAAIQRMYGADFTTNATSTTYSFSAVTGEMFVNGVGQGAPGANRVFLTVWDGGGTDIYDFSNYSTNQSIDLTPGSWSLMSSMQRANLGSGNYARGNLFNALQYEGSIASLIENAIGGSGNDTILGNMADNLINGGIGTDSLSGGAGVDTLEGASGNDVLDGGTGSDVLNGGDGNDIYYVDSSDVLTEWSGALSGFDTVYSTTNFTLTANIEQLLLTAGATVGTGNGGDNVLYATLLFTGASLFGLAGNDAFYGSNYADSIDGGADNDVLLAYYSVNGADTLVGGSGDDVYFLFEQGDVVTELLGGGLDTYYTQANVTLAANVEQAVVYGVATAVTGNSGNNNLFANNSSFSVTLDGGAGNDWMIGSSLSDTLLGGADNDILQGLAGANLMSGGTGDDQYFSTSATDVITEAVNEGRDTVYASYNVTTLAANVEQLSSSGGATIGNGNNLDNTLYGNNNTIGMSLDGGAGADLIFGSNFADTIIGGTGNDIMVGGTGADRFAYTSSGNMGADLIIDFTDGADRIDLTGLGYNMTLTNITIAASGADTLITFAGGNLQGTTLTLAGVSAVNVTVADFVV